MRWFKFVATSFSQVAVYGLIGMGLFYTLTSGEISFDMLSQCLLVSGGIVAAISMIYYFFVKNSLVSKKEVKLHYPKKDAMQLLITILNSISARITMVDHAAGIIKASYGFLPPQDINCKLSCEDDLVKIEISYENYKIAGAPAPVITSKIESLLLLANN